MASKVRWLASALLVSLPSAWPQGTPRSGNPLDTLPPVPARPAEATRALVPQAEPRAAIPADQPLTPSRFEIEGVRAIPFEPIAARFSAMAGKPTTVGALAAAVEQANQMYRDAGFALSFFYLPQQDFAGGVVRIAAVEGYVDQIRIEGDAGISRQQVMDIANHLREEKPLTLASFERYTGILAQLPGVVVQANVPPPATTDGAAVMTLTVQRRPYALSLGGEIGQPQSRAVVTAEVNDLLVPGNRVSVSALPLQTGSDRYYAASYAQHIGSQGLVLKLATSWFRGDPNAALGVDPGPLERRGTNRRVDVSLGYPLMLSASRSLTLTGGAYAVNSADTLGNPATGATLTDDVRSRAVFAQLAYAESRPGVDRVASVMLVQGVKAGGARAELVSNVPGLSGPDGIELRFTRVLVQAAQAMRFSNEVGLSAAVIAQYSGHALPPSERISFGGTRFGRGYAPGQTSGDSGHGLSLEVNRRLPLPLGGGRLVLEPYLMAEAARVRARAGTPVPAHLVSLTAGARLTDQRHYTVDLGVSKPLGDPPLENPDRKLRTHLLISYRLGDP